ncbi:hypothetical protein N9C64_00625 [Paracoccaceae bacterium]|nr:hypothetical protein [Paracoccaceae bacterium]
MEKNLNYKKKLASARVLILYAERNLSVRLAVKNHTFCFRKCETRNKYYYWNCWYDGIPSEKFIDEFDSIIYDYTFCDVRFRERKFKVFMEKLKLMQVLRRKFCIAMPQDEFIHLHLLNELNNYGGVNVISSVANPDNWKYIYPNAKQTIIWSLTGYVPDNWRDIRSKYSEESRHIDILYRAHADLSWGKFNFLKKKLADQALVVCKNLNLHHDIKTGIDNFLLGDLWWRSLSRSNATLGVESGVDQFWWSHKDLEDARAPEDFKIHTISPRHFEAGMLGVTQILITGDYNDILIPGRHYIPIKEDLSDLNDAIKLSMDRSVCEKINNAFDREILESGKYCYQEYVNKFDNIISMNCETQKSKQLSYFSRLSLIKNYLVSIIFRTIFFTIKSGLKRVSIQ